MTRSVLGGGRAGHPWKQPFWCDCGSRTGVDSRSNEGKKKPALAGLIDWCDIAIELIHQRRQLFELLRQMPSVGSAVHVNRGLFDAGQYHLANHRVFGGGS